MESRRTWRRLALPWGMHSIDPIAGHTAGATRPSRSRRRAGVVLGATAAACAVLTALPGTASADPSPAQLTQQVADASHQLEVVSEQVNQARTELQQQQAAVEPGRPGRRRGATPGCTRWTARSASWPARVYTTGDVSRVDVLLSSRSAGDLVAQMGTLDAIAGHQTAVVKQVSDAAAAARAARASAQAAAAAAQRTRRPDQRRAVPAAGADRRLPPPVRRAHRRAAAGGRAAGDRYAGGGHRPPLRWRPRPSRPPAPVVAGSAARPPRSAPRWRRSASPTSWGAAGPSAFDCSGLMQYSWGAAGVALPHSSNAQSGMGTPVSRDAAAAR